MVMDNNLGPYTQFTIPPIAKDTDEFWRSVLRDVNAHKNWEFFLHFIDLKFDIESGTLASSANILSLLSLGLPPEVDYSQLEFQTMITNKIWNLAMNFSDLLILPIDPLNLNYILTIIRSGRRCGKDTQKFSNIVYNTCVFTDMEEDYIKIYERDLNIVFTNNREVINFIYEDFDENLANKFYNFVYSISKNSETFNK